MIRRFSATISSVLGIAITALLVAACGGAAGTATPAPSAAPAASPSAVVGPSAGLSPSTAPSGSVGPSGSANPSGSAPASGASGTDIGLPHVEARLEDLLPSTIGGVTLEKFSLTLSAYIASTTGGDKALYAPWLVKFGKTPDDVNMAVAADLTGQENFILHAIDVPGVDDATLSSSFGDVAHKAGWTVNSKTVADKSVLEMIDPAAAASGGLSVGYVWAKDGVLYTIITDDSSLLLEALIRTPEPSATPTS
jgi:hypothetical protein